MCTRISIAGQVDLMEYQHVRIGWFASNLAIWKGGGTLHSVFIIFRLILAGIDNPSLCLQFHSLLSWNFSTIRISLCELFHILFSTPFSTPEKEGGISETDKLPTDISNITTIKATSQTIASN